MTGGIVVILGKVGENFSAGMTGGMAFVYDTNNHILDVNSNNPLSSKDGKIKVLKNLNLQNPIYIIGDGYTDFEMKQVQGVKAFICYTENINRPSVSKVADYVAKNLKHVFAYIESNG